MALNLSSILASFARPVNSAVNFMRPEPSEQQRAEMEEYAFHGQQLLAGGQVLRQATPQTCGAMALLVARAYLLPGVRRELEENPSFVPAFERELYAQLRKNAIGPFEWPEKFGTPPWTLARELSDVRPELTYWHTAVDDTTERGWTVLQWVAHATTAGLPVPLYMGDDVDRGLANAIPRHVVLAIPGAKTTPDGIPQISIYNPGTGLVHEVPLPVMIDRTDKMRALGNWTHVVSAVLPDSVRD